LGATNRVLANRALAALLAAYPVVAVLHLLAVRLAWLPARPGDAALLGALPAAALLLALSRRRWGAVALGLAELLLAVLAHGLVTTLQAWRLD